jgi:hypothetical protein
MRNGRDPELEREWRRRIAAWPASGQTKKLYCQARGFSLASYYFWQAEIRRRDKEPTITPMAPRFVPVRIIPSPIFKVKVRCPSGHVVTVAGSDSVTLSSIFTALSRDA